MAQFDDFRGTQPPLAAAESTRTIFQQRIEKGGREIFEHSSNLEFVPWLTLLAPSDRGSHLDVRPNSM